MRPSSASTSRTRMPLARPPMLGLQLIWPTLASGAGVTSSVRAPRRAAAAAASQPASQVHPAQHIGSAKLQCCLLAFITCEVIAAVFAD